MFIIWGFKKVVIELLYYNVLFENLNSLVSVIYTFSDTVFISSPAVFTAKYTLVIGFKSKCLVAVSTAKDGSVPLPIAS